MAILAALDAAEQVEQKAQTRNKQHNWYCKLKVHGRQGKVAECDCGKDALDEALATMQRIREGK